MSGCGHTQAEHDAIRNDDARWQELPIIGYQPGSTEHGGDLEMRNIPGSECTLVRPCVLTESQRVAAREANRLKRERMSGEIARALSRAGLRRAA